MLGMGRAKRIDRAKSYRTRLYTCPCVLESSIQPAHEQEHPYIITYTHPLKLIDRCNTTRVLGYP
jgi:hypothetical protein